MKSYENMNILEKIRHDHDRDMIYSDDGQHVNHPIRRFFRCWLDGSYNGEGHYRANVEFLWANRNNQRALRGFIIREFTEYTASEYSCSTGYAGTCIVDSFTRTELEVLNGQLIEDALDLIEDRIRQEEEE